MPEGRLMHVQVAGRPLCLVRKNGRLHALLDRCPHQGGSFAGGWCEGEHLVCPRHRMGFHVATGHGRQGGTERAMVFPVEECPDGTYIGFP